MAVRKAKELMPAQRIRRTVQGQDYPQKSGWPQPVGKMIRWDPEPGSGKFSECIFWVKSDPLCGLKSLGTALGLQDRVCIKTS